MTITLPFTAPDFWESFHLLDGSSEFELLNYDQQSMDGAGNAISARLGEPQWISDVEIAPQYNIDAGKLEARIKLLQGRDGAFLAYDKRRPHPASDPDGSRLATGSNVAIGGEAAYGDVSLSGGTYRYEGMAVPLSDAVSMVSDPGTYYDADGVLQTSAANVVRLDYGPFANHIRNFRAAGSTVGVIGSGGVAPTNWLILAGSGIAAEIVETGAENGIEYIDIKFSGTAIAGLVAAIEFESNTQVAARQSQTWVTSAWLKLVSGSLATIGSLRFGLREALAAGTFVADTLGLDIDTSITSLLTRYSAPLSVVEAATERIKPKIYIGVGGGAAVNFTLRVGAPLLNQGAAPITYPRAPLGILVEEETTNSIRNNMRIGAVAGSPGTLPTRWGINGAAGLTRTITLETVNGIECLRIRWVGTTSSATPLQFNTEGNNQIVAAKDQTWTHSVFFQVLNGVGLAGLDWRLEMWEYSSTPAFLAGSGTGTTIPSTVIENALTRRIHSRALAPPPTAFVMPMLRVNGTIPIGTVCDIEIRMGLPQLEQRPTISMPIRTANATGVTRAADALSIKARGSNNFVMTYDTGETLVRVGLYGNLSPLSTTIDGRHIKSWTATRATQPLPSTVTIKTKGANNRSLALQGLPPFYRLSAGDRVSVANASGLIELFEIVEDATADIKGDTVEFELQPFLASWIAVGQAVSLSRPCAKFKIVKGSYKRGTIEARRTVGRGFSIHSVT